MPLALRALLLCAASAVLLPVACTTSHPAGGRILTAADLDDVARDEEKRAASVASEQSAALRARASAHRASAEALRETADATCAGVPDSDRDAEPFSHPDLVEAVAPIVDYDDQGKARVHHPRGVVIVLRATPGLTRPWLSRVLRCHMAHHARAPLSQENADPLAVGRPLVSVAETETGFAVEIRGATPEDATEILRRAENLMGQRMTR